MRFCKQCGATFEGEMVFCLNCGNMLEVQDEKAPGNSRSVADLYSQGTDYTKPAEFVPIKRNRSRLPIVLAICAVLVVLAVIFVPKFLAVQQGFDTSNNGGSSSPSVTEENKVSSYEVYRSDLSWNEASRNALERDGYLVCINDPEEFEKVCALADEQGLKVFWVGAKRTSSQSWNDTRWSDGKELVYTKWFQGEPTYYSEDGDDENYLMVFNVNGQWYYNDAIGDVSKYYSGKMGYIIEIKK